MPYHKKKYKKKFHNNDWKIGKKKVEVKHSCGCIKTHFIKWDNADRTVEFLETQLCSECEAERLLELGAETHEVSYADYKTFYQPAYIKTVPDSYDEVKKTIEIIATEEDMSNAKTKYYIEKSEEVFDEEY